jgi:propionate CoA-transferase
MAKLVYENKIEAYALPQGRIANLYKAMAGGAPGLLSPIGLDTYVDPEIEGGKANELTRGCEDIVERVRIGDRTYLLYKKIPIDVVLMRGTCADEKGNISMQEEAVKLEALSAALATRRFGGKVIVQVKWLTKQGSLHPKEIVIPGIFVDAVVLAQNQEITHRQTATNFYDPSFCGDIKAPEITFQPIPLNLRKIIGRRAILEITPGATVNLGTGIPGDTIGPIAAEEGVLSHFILTVESGTIGGIPGGGIDFGLSRNPDAIINHMDQFDFYTGCGVDITFMGAAEVDSKGNVNVSKFGGRVAGCGGFIDITQRAKKVVFCFSFTVGKIAIETSNGKLKILQDGKSGKFLPRVNHITFSGGRAKEMGQKVLYVTERAVFELRPEGLTLMEIAPGVNLEKDILGKMQFKPKIAPKLKEMDKKIFLKGAMKIEEILKKGCKNAP